MRKNNEDAFGFFGKGGSFLGDQGAVEANQPLIAIVSDGVGGHDSGEVASAATIAAVGAGLGLLIPQLERDQLEQETVEAIEEMMGGLNQHVREFSTQRGQSQKMAATLTAACFAGGKLITVHAGDSRLYRIRGGHLSCLTVDDTEAGRAVAAGKMTAEQARQHSRKNILQNAVGVESSQFSVAVERFDVEPEDLYFLCSDGVTDGLSDQHLERAFKQLDPSDMGTFAARLIEAANAASGRDNSTVLFIHVGKNWPFVSNATVIKTSKLNQKSMMKTTIPLYATALVLGLLILFVGWWAHASNEKLASNLEQLSSGLRSDISHFEAQTDEKIRRLQQSLSEVHRNSGIQSAAIRSDLDPVLLELQNRSERTALSIQGLQEALDHLARNLKEQERDFTNRLSNLQEALEAASAPEPTPEDPGAEETIEPQQEESYHLDHPTGEQDAPRE